MARRTRKKGPMAEINVVPYIDVMLVLLVIFMITTPLLSQGVKVNLPKASAQALSAKSSEPIIVTVDAAGNFYLNIAKNPGTALPAVDLVNQAAAAINTSQQNNDDRQVLVKADRSVDYGKVVQAMVLLQQAGAQSVGLMTESPSNDNQG